MSKMLSSVLLCCFMSGMAMATAQPSTHVQKNVVPGGDSDTIAAIAGSARSSSMCYQFLTAKIGIEPERDLG